MLSGLSENNTKSTADKAKLAGSYTLLMSSLMLQISDPNLVWTPAKIISLVLMLISVILAKEYKNSDCQQTASSSTSATSETSNEPIPN